MFSAHHSLLKIQSGNIVNTPGWISLWDEYLSGVRTEPLPSSVSPKNVQTQCSALKGHTCGHTRQAMLLLMAEERSSVYVYIYMYTHIHMYTYSLSFHLLLGSYGCLHILAVVNNSTIWDNIDGP